MKLIHPEESSSTDTSPVLQLDAIGKVPAMEFRQREDGKIEFRYVVKEEKYSGFDGQWRVMTEGEQRDTIRMGGQLAEWLLSLDENPSRETL
jgi:hypothetical protein